MSGFRNTRYGTGIATAVYRLKRRMSWAFGATASGRLRDRLILDNRLFADFSGRFPVKTYLGTVRGIAGDFPPAFGKCKRLEGI